MRCGNGSCNGWERWKIDSPDSFCFICNKWYTHCNNTAFSKAWTIVVLVTVRQFLFHPLTSRGLSTSYHMYPRWTRGPEWRQSTSIVNRVYVVAASSQVLSICNLKQRNTVTNTKSSSDMFDTTSQMLIRLNQTQCKLFPMLKKGNHALHVSCAWCWLSS